MPVSHINHVRSRFIPRHSPSIRFGESVQTKLAVYKDWLHNVHLKNLTPEDGVEPKTILSKVLRALREPPENVTLKKPGDYVFVVWDGEGFAQRNGKKKADSSGAPKGFFWSDMQYIDHYKIQGPKNTSLKLINKTIEDIRGRFTYEVVGNKKLSVEREDRIDKHHLNQSLIFRNKGTKDAEFVVQVGASANDIFQARTGNKIQGPKLRKDTKHSSNNASFLAFTSHPNNATYPENLINSILHIPQSVSNNVRLTLSEEQDMMEIRVTVPAGKTVQVPLLIQSNNLYTELNAPTHAFDNDRWAKTMPQISAISQNKASNPLTKIWETASADLKRLAIPVQCGEKTYFPIAAGIPNFLALFGRDSIVTAFQVLPLNPKPAKDTLYVLSHFQGNGHDEFREMEPGKILHELRYGELTRLGLSPHGPYYGSIDATPLFVMLFDQYTRRTNDKELPAKLWPNLEAALTWIDNTIAANNGTPIQGFLSQRLKEQTDAGSMGLKNIGWKDSGHSMRHLLNENGKLKDPKYPLALAEVQAYIYGAWKGAARLYAKRAQDFSDQPQQKEAFLKKASEYRERAAELKKQFNERFWMPNHNFIATALQADGTQLPSISSNGAQVLLTGIVDNDKAVKMAERLTQTDMLSGWGLRTLSAKEPAYDPLSYHNGGIWPHDNSLIVAGLSKYGLRNAAQTIANQLLQAARTFPKGRLPEVYAGFERKAGDRKIIPYPDTCVPQAWASAAPFSLLVSMLGLQVDAEKKQLVFRHPRLPKGVNTLELKGIPVSQNERLDIQIQRLSNRSVQVTQIDSSHPTSFQVKVIP